MHTFPPLKYEKGDKGAVPFREIPLLGEMSAKQTKGCPFLEEKVASSQTKSEGAI